MIFNNDSQDKEKQIVRKEILNIGGKETHMGDSAPSGLPNDVPMSYADVVRNSTTSESNDIRAKRVQFKFDKNQ